MHMKTFILSFLLFVSLGLIAQQTYVPDDNFEQALIDLGYDTEPLDDYIPTANIDAITTLNIQSKNIADLTGIEDFTALTNLDCFGNQLTSLSLSGNTALTHLKCAYNQLTSLDISANAALYLLHCNKNQLTSLDASNKPALRYLDCMVNQLTNIDITSDTALEELSCINNQLASIDVSTNTALKHLDCDYNQLTSLDISNNTALSYLFCSNNQLTSIDVTSNTALSYFVCTDNPLTSLDVSSNSALEDLYCYNNQLTYIDIRNGYNEIITTFKAIDNPDLTCIYVDDKDATYLNGWKKDSTAIFANNESECTVSIDDLTHNSKFVIFPNPAKEQFSIETNQIIESISIYTISGSLVKSYTKQNSYSVNGLQSGVYILHIQCGSYSYTKRLIIE